MRIDFKLSGGGTVDLFEPLTPAARGWIAERLPVNAMRLGEAVAVEWHCIGDIAGGAIADGLRAR